MDAGTKLKAIARRVKLSRDRAEILRQRAWDLRNTEPERATQLRTTAYTMLSVLSGIEFYLTGEDCPQCGGTGTRKYGDDISCLTCDGAGLIFA